MVLDHPTSPAARDLIRLATTRPLSPCERLQLSIALTPELGDDLADEVAREVWRLARDGAAS